MACHKSMIFMRFRDNLSHVQFGAGAREKLAPAGWCPRAIGYNSNDPDARPAGRFRFVRCARHGRKWRNW